MWSFLGGAATTPFNLRADCLEFPRTGEVGESEGGVKLTWLFVAVLIVAPALSPQLSDEAKAWMPWLIERLIRHAVRRLPQGKRQRVARLWKDRINGIPGDVGKLFMALCAMRSRRLRIAGPGGL